MLEDYNEIAGFCVLEWVMQSPTGAAFVFRCAVFILTGWFVCTVLNVAWLLGMRGR